MRPRPTERVGLYDPEFEHDACGVTLVARLNGVPTHETVVRGLTAVGNLEHRGAAGADPNTGDGAGILLQMPDRFIRAVVGDGAASGSVDTGSASASSRGTTPAGSSSSSSWSRPSRPRDSEFLPGGTFRSTTGTSG